MSFKRVTKAWTDHEFILGVGFPPEIAGPLGFVTRWNMSYEENDAMVALQDVYYDKWLAAKQEEIV